MFTKNPDSGIGLKSTELGDFRALAMKEALEDGQICLAPTDTLPGLSFHALNQSLAAQLNSLKARPAAKPFLGLASSAEMAFKCWEPLPQLWYSMLKVLWPSPLTVIYRASESCPESLKSAEGFVALRLPKLRAEDGWLLEMIEAMGVPLPSSSVNFYREDPESSWSSAVRWARLHKVSVPVEACTMCPSQVQSSTIVQLAEDGSFELKRGGAFHVQKISELLESMADSNV